MFELEQVHSVIEKSIEVTTQQKSRTVDKWSIKWHLNDQKYNGNLNSQTKSLSVRKFPLNFPYLRIVSILLINVLPTPPKVPFSIRPKESKNFLNKKSVTKITQLHRIKHNVTTIYPFKLKLNVRWKKCYL